MYQEWICVGVGDAGPAAEQALVAASFQCPHQDLDEATGLKVLIRAGTTDREKVEQILRQVNGRDAWIRVVSWTPKDPVVGYRAALEPE